MGGSPGFLAMRRKKKVIIWSLRKEWRIVYDETWREVMREAGDEMSIPVGDVERMNSAWWKYVGEMIARPELPQIRMMYLGTIRASVKKLWNYCASMSDGVDRFKRGWKYNHYGKEIGDVDAMEVHLAKLDKTYFRIVEERKSGEMSEKKRRNVDINLGGKMIRARELRKEKMEKEKNNDKERGNS